MKPAQSVILCPGQGAQRVGMGKRWRDASDVFARTLTQADELLEGELGFALSRACFDGPEERLSRTDVAQPALFAVGVACFRALAGDAGDEPPAAAAGLSLGEYTALHLAGAFSFEDALRLVALRGRAMQQAAEASAGAMVALVGANEALAERICQECARGQTLVGANFNAPGQIVLSGDSDACQRALERASELGVRAAPLPVAGAFHSPLMARAADQLAAALEEVEIRPPRCPVPSNVSGEPHAWEGDQSDAPAASIRRLLVKQLTSPVRWDSCCAWLAKRADGELHELAPGRTLAGLARRIDRSLTVVSHDDPDDPHDPDGRD